MVVALAGAAGAGCLMQVALLWHREIKNKCSLSLSLSLSLSVCLCARENNSSELFRTSSRNGFCRIVHDTLWV